MSNNQDSYFDFMDEWNTPSTTAGSSSNFNFMDTLSSAGDWISGIANTGVTALSKWDDYKLGRELNDLRIEAIKSNARAAPTLAQASLPSMADFQRQGTTNGVPTNIPQGGDVNSRVRDVLVAGAAADKGGDILMYAALAFGAWIMLK